MTAVGECSVEKSFLIHNGDCLEIMGSMPDCSVSAIVTDPPYGLGKEPDPAEVLQAWIEQKQYQAQGKGFMGAEWDSFVPSPIIWQEALRVLKHGGHILCFAGTRTQDWMTMSLRFAGFEIRDVLMFLYGSGFPKSLDVSKHLDKKSDVQFTGRQLSNNVISASAQEWQGWKSHLKPAYEPIILARKPLDGTISENVLKHGVGALNIDGCRIGTDEIRTNGFASANTADDLFPRYHKDRSEYQGNMHIGRYPANIIHDGSDEVIQAFPITNPSKANQQSDNRSTNFYRCGGLTIGGVAGRRDPLNSYTDEGGSAARFFYCAKASKEDRDEGLEEFALQQYSHDGRGKPIENPYQRNNSLARNNHPTVKPTELMRYLCRLITPPDGIVLDPFCGSGSTGKAALLEGFNFIGIELDPHYAKIAQARCQFASDRVNQIMTIQDQNGSVIKVQQLDLFTEVL